MELILQQVAGSQMMSFLDGLFGYNQIIFNNEDKYKPHVLIFGAHLHMK
jgi:hypothetical protein